MESEATHILAIETATMIGSIALFTDGQLQGQIDYRRAKTHARLLTPMISHLLADLELAVADLSAVGVAKGPGSYTGLRVGVSTAKGLCMAMNKPLLSMSSLLSLAYQVQDLAKQLDAWICPMIDARRMEVYCELYDAELAVKQEVHARIIDDSSFAEELDQHKIIFLGDGAAKCQDVIHHNNALFLPNYLSTAASMGTELQKRFQHGQLEDLLTFEPFYLKDFVATKSKKNLLK